MSEEKKDYNLNKKDQGKYESMFIPPIANELASYVFQLGRVNGYKYFSFTDVEDGLYRYLNALQRHIDSIKQHYIDTRNFNAIEKESQIPEVAFLVSNAMMITHILITEMSKRCEMSVREYIDNEVKPKMLEAFNKIKNKQGDKKQYE